jgi:hypothetical protein
MNPELSTAHEPGDPTDADVTPDSVSGIPIGQLLVDAGVLTEDVLEEVLEKQARTGRRLGEILVQDGYVSSRVMANALAEQHGGMLRTEYGVALGMQPAQSEGIPYSPPPATLDRPDETPAPVTETPAAPEQPIRTERPPIFKAQLAAEEPQVDEPTTSDGPSAEQAPPAPLEVTITSLEELTPAEESEPDVEDVETSEASPLPESLLRPRVRVEEVAEQLASAHADLDEEHAVEKHDRLTQALDEAEARALEAEGRAKRAEAELERLQERLEELEAELASVAAGGEGHTPVEVAVPLQDRHLLFVPNERGYELREAPGPMPAVGTAVEVEGSHFVVIRVGPSPLPGDPASCAFLVVL